LNPTLAWVIGRGGLLGSQLARHARDRLAATDCWPCLVPRFSWSDPAAFAAELELATGAYAEAVRGQGRQWLILWCAGSGVIGSDEASLQQETRAFALLLERIDRHLGPALRGRIFLASSAGGVYGAAGARLLEEASPCEPISAYGRNKLRQENLLTAWAADRPHVSCLIGRIANLYGPGQNLAKPQGFISQLSLSLIHNVPFHIYVPLDTVRDFLYVEDCADHILRSLDRLGAAPPGCVVKIFASEHPTSLARVLGIFTRIARHRPRLISAPRLLGSQQPLALTFRSTVWRDVTKASTTDLMVGIHRTHQYQLAMFHRGQLPNVGIRPGRAMSAAPREDQVRRQEAV
jgi:UDP-glucose 4-epimerase